MDAWFMDEGRLLASLGPLVGCPGYNQTDGSGLGVEDHPTLANFTLPPVLEASSSRGATKASRLSLSLSLSSRASGWRLLEDVHTPAETPPSTRRSTKEQRNERFWVQMERRAATLKTRVPGGQQAVLVTSPASQTRPWASDR